MGRTPLKDLERKFREGRARALRDGAVTCCLCEGHTDQFIHDLPVCHSCYGRALNNFRTAVMRGHVGWWLDHYGGVVALLVVGHLPVMRTLMKQPFPFLAEPLSLTRWEDLYVTPEIAEFADEVARVWDAVDKRTERVIIDQLTEYLLREGVIAEPNNFRLKKVLGEKAALGRKVFVDFVRHAEMAAGEE